MRRALSRFLLLFAAALLTSCGGNSLTFIINQQGGEWLLPGGVGLVVPPGAVDEPTEVTARLLVELSDDGWPALPKWVAAVPEVAISFEPHGLTFREPVILTLPVLNPGSPLTVVRAGRPEASTWQPMLRTALHDDLLVVQIDGFSAYASTRANSDSCPVLTADMWRRHAQVVRGVGFRHACRPGMMTESEIRESSYEDYRDRTPLHSHPDLNVRAWQQETYEKFDYLLEYPGYYPGDPSGLAYPKGYQACGTDYIDEVPDTFAGSLGFAGTDYFFEISCQSYRPHCQVFDSRGTPQSGWIWMKRNAERDSQGRLYTSSFEMTFGDRQTWYPGVGADHYTVLRDQVDDIDAAWAACKALASSEWPDMAPTVQVTGLERGQSFVLEEVHHGLRAEITGDAVAASGGLASGPAVPGDTNYSFRIASTHRSVERCTITSGATGRSDYPQQMRVHCVSDEQGCDGIDNDGDGRIDENADADGDGHTTCGRDGRVGTSDDDCDDGNPAIHPGARERCDDVDDDCDGTAGEDTDFDQDGHSCHGSDGVRGTADDDCDDNDPAFHAGAPDPPMGPDMDCAPGPDDDGDGALIGVDCDDGDPTRYPGAPETCDDGIDHDCDTSLSETADLNSNEIVDACEPLFTAFDADLCPLASAAGSAERLHAFLDAALQLGAIDDSRHVAVGLTPGFGAALGVYRYDGFELQARVNTLNGVTLPRYRTIDVWMRLTGEAGRYSAELGCTDETSGIDCELNGMARGLRLTDLTQAQDIACQLWMNGQVNAWKDAD